MTIDVTLPERGGFDVRIERTRWKHPKLLGAYASRRDWLREYAQWLVEQDWLVDTVGKLRDQTIADRRADGPCPAHVVALLADDVTDDPHEAVEIAFARHEEADHV